MAAAERVTVRWRVRAALPRSSQRFPRLVHRENVTGRYVGSGLIDQGQPLRREKLVKILSVEMEIMDKHVRHVLINASEAGGMRPPPGFFVDAIVKGVCSHTVSPRTLFRSTASLSAAAQKQMITETTASRHIRASAASPGWLFSK